jgi:Amt family ammonium transporter
LGVVAVAAWALGGSALIFGLIKATVSLRVSAEEEIEGLDIGEHGMWGYPESFLGLDAIPTHEMVGRARLQARQRAEGAVPLPQEAT